MINDLSNLRTLEDVRLFFFKYKDTPQFSIIGITLLILVSVGVIARVVMPQFDSWFSMQNEIKATKERIATMQENVSIISSMSENQLTNQFNLATGALPYEKDYTGVLTTIDSIAISSGVALDDYSFQVGNLSTTSAQLAPETAISVKISVKGDLPSIQKFIQKLNEITPLSEVVTVSYANNGAGLGVIFFYKYLPKNLKIPYTDPIRTVSAERSTLIKKLTDWNNAAKTNTQNFSSPSVASSSGE